MNIDLVVAKFPTMIADEFEKAHLSLVINTLCVYSKTVPSICKQIVKMRKHGKLTHKQNLLIKLTKTHLCDVLRDNDDEVLKAKIIDDLRSAASSYDLGRYKPQEQRGVRLGTMPKAVYPVGLVRG